MAPPAAYQTKKAGDTRLSGARPSPKCNAQAARS
jgi:hypothetical protein